MEISFQLFKKKNYCDVMPFNDITNILKTPTKRGKTTKKKVPQEFKPFVRRYIHTLTPRKRNYVLSNLEIRGGQIYDSISNISHSKTPDPVRHRMLEIQRASLSLNVSPLKLVASNSRSFFAFGSVSDWNDEVDLERNVVSETTYSPRRRRRISACETIQNVSLSAKSVLNQTISFLVCRAQCLANIDANAYAKHLIRQFVAVEKKSDFTNNTHDDGMSDGTHFTDLEVGSLASSSSSSMANSNDDVVVVSLSLV